MLLEFLPHLTRLIPAADRYLSSRPASDKAHEAALAALSEDQRSAFSKVTAENAALKSHLQQLITDSAQLRAETSVLRTSLEGLDSRVTRIESRVTAVSRVLWVVVAMLAAVLVIVLLRK
jgi:chromosome segregation ATPase